MNSIGSTEDKHPYTFLPKFAEFMEELLHYYELDNVRKELENAGGKKYEELEHVKVELKKFNKGNLDRYKRYYLDKHVFRCMANLIFFFEYLADHRELREVFEDDIKELFGYIGNYQFDKGKPGYQNIMVRFMESLLRLDTTDNESNDFRLGLIGDIQGILYLKISHLASKEFVAGKKPTESDKAVYETINSHMRQALAWVQMYNHKYTNSQEKIDKEDIPTRPVSF